MSSTDNPDSEGENRSDLSRQVPKSKVQTLFQELEIMAMQKGSKNALDFNKLNPEQINQVLATLKENENNAFAYHTKRLDAIKEIEIKKIDASVINQKTYRYSVIGLLIAGFVIIVLILIFKENFFIPWLTFLTGILGGFGLGRSSIGKIKEENKNPIKDDDDD
ncbi:MAG: hypothetical protein COW65_00480 [Cytophagales bacterium CG18_big_fil_WC_8_21_14_2_50_42_9]|nr:MAG: hypothetical protein COW65_00480 [Cytophagales bacterium CG18_big_fil_WC_8_21_14_2_50_42_9]